MGNLFDAVVLQNVSEHGRRLPICVHGECWIDKNLPPGNWVHNGGPPVAVNQPPQRPDWQARCDACKKPLEPID